MIAVRKKSRVLQRHPDLRVDVSNGPQRRSSPSLLDMSDNPISTKDIPLKTGTHRYRDNEERSISTNRAVGHVLAGHVGDQTESLPSQIVRASLSEDQWGLPLPRDEAAFSGLVEQALSHLPASLRDELQEDPLFRVVVNPLKLLDYSLLQTYVPSDLLSRLRMATPPDVS